MSKAVERPVLAGLEQVAEARVGLLDGAEARELAHRPEPAAVHRRVDAARERDSPGKPSFSVGVEAREVLGRVERPIGGPRVSKGVRAPACGVLLLAPLVCAPRDSGLDRHAKRLPTRDALDWRRCPWAWSDEVDEILGGDLAAGFAYLTPAKGVVITPMAPLGLRDREARHGHPHDLARRCGRSSTGSAATPASPSPTTRASTG